MGANYKRKIASLKMKNGSYTGQNGAEKNGSYTDQNGAEKNRYHEVGVLLATPHASQLLIKMHATAHLSRSWFRCFWMKW